MNTEYFLGFKSGVYQMGRYLTLVHPDQHSNGRSAYANPSAAVWVKLAALPNPYSHDRAMLLCRHADDEWVAWIPDHGEVILHRSEFFVEPDWN
ncbi:hypothetical protein C7B61_21985 [filamentous cyanobacterium CCP1]|nr:hypothetical protein C7B76_28985 [filamentous cyanobacterium CCP2]PSB54752.1 hypothetical protein C7B61_21985 [filamentous cyanobacterium CCP1]